VWSRRLRLIGWLLATLPLTARSASVTEQELDAVLASRPDSVQGERLFETCAACHGTHGGGASDGTVPAIAAQHFRVIARELIAFRHDKRSDLRMRHFTDQRHLPTPQDVANLASYVSAMPPTQAPDVGDGAAVEHGAAVYARLCASCHGSAAQGNDRLGYPRLAGQHYAYLLRQMHDAVEGRRPNFSREHIRLLERFESADFLGVSDYLSRLGP